MDFRDALNTIRAELTPQPWDYTDNAGTTLTVVPAGLREDPGCAEVMIRITVDKTIAAEIGVTTTYMVSLLHALDTRTGWEHVSSFGDELTVAPDDGGLVLVVTESAYRSSDPAFCRPETTAAIHIPEAQRLPLASALRRALDVARGWEDA